MRISDWSSDVCSSDLFGGEVTEGLVTGLEKDGDIFLVHVETGAWQARSVLLATGVVNNAPPMSPDIHDAALRQGLLRYCPICDGYEATDRRIAVIGTGERGANEAMFLRTYSADISLISPQGDHELSADQRMRLEEAGVALVNGPCEPLRDRKSTRLNSSH